MANCWRWRDGSGRLHPVASTRQTLGSVDLPCSHRLSVVRAALPEKIWGDVESWSDGSSVGTRFPSRVVLRAITKFAPVREPLVPRASISAQQKSTKSSLRPVVFMCNIDITCACDSACACVRVCVCVCVCVFSVPCFSDGRLRKPHLTWFSAFGFGLES